MPELPEVETVRRGLAKLLVGRRIDGVDFRPAKRLRGAGGLPLEGLEGQTVAAVRRHGKYLLIDLDGGLLLAHLGMTGKLLFAQPGEAERPHTHLVLHLDDETELRFSDPRRFGTLKLYPKDAEVPELAHYGPDALAPAFSKAHLLATLKASGSPLKLFLLDQRKVAGVGNIYACEALWRTRLSPTRKARSVPAAKVPELWTNVRQTLRDAIAKGGTSFNDYVDHIGQPGQFVAELAVYDREGQPCPRCEAPVRRIAQSGRSTFFCKACQK